MSPIEPPDVNPKDAIMLPSAETKRYLDCFSTIVCGIHLNHRLCTLCARACQRAFVHWMAFNDGRKRNGVINCYG
jgi:hypothetical protein